MNKPLLHPILWAIVPVLYLFEKNIEFVNYRETIPPILINLGITAVILVISHLLTNDWKKAGFQATIFLLLFSTFGHLFHFAASQGLSSIVGQVLFLVFLVLFILLSWLNFRVLKCYMSIIEFLNMVSITLILISSVNIIRVFQSTDSSISNPTISTAQTPTTLPDIYYFIFDGYGGNEMFYDIYGFDNSPFVSELKTRGFYVANGSFSNYVRTVQSLNSTLNLQYLEDDKNWSTNLNYLYKNYVKEQLRFFGYTIYTGHNEFDTTNWTGSKSIGIPPLGTSFFRQYLNSTAFILFSNQITLDHHRNLILNSFTSIEDVVKNKSPKFVFMHMITPHPPFIFDQNGSDTQKNTPFTFFDGSELGLPAKEYQALYLNQMKFINQKILEVVDLILENSVTPPIIIIQGDHGPRSTIDLEIFANNPCFYEGFSILNAYYFPNHDYDDLYNNITPVNSFRIVLNRYFGFSFKLLEDRAFYAPDTDYNDKSEVTSMIKEKVCTVGP